MSNIVNSSGIQQFETQVIKSELPVLVDFWAPWCGPCQMMAPVLEEIQKSMGDKIKIVKVDTEDQSNQELAWKFQIQSIPNMKLFKNGQVVKEFIGFRPKEVLTNDLETFLST